jgi:hypothetical protein
MNASPIHTKYTLAQTAIILIILIFGLLTLFMSSSVIFDLFNIRAKEGNYVPFIVWANFVSSLLYLGVVWGFIKRSAWTTHVLAFVTLLLTISFIGLLIYIYQGGIYETKTLYAMVFRILITIAFTLFSRNINSIRLSKLNENTQ